MACVCVCVDTEQTMKQSGAAGDDDDVLEDPQRCRCWESGSDA